VKYDGGGQYICGGVGAGVIDSQSARTTEKGGLGAMMAARKSRGGNAIFW